jgi:carbamoyl-phosphate synthase large subunit
MLPLTGAVLITVAKQDRVGGLEAAKKFVQLGFKIFATEGTHTYFAQHGVTATLIKKMHEGRPNIADAIKNGEIQLVVNTPIGRLGIHDDSYIRKAAIKYKIPYITTTAAASAAAEGIAACRVEGKGKVRSLQEYHQQL